jgi:hypothetical protein
MEFFLDNFLPHGQLPRKITKIMSIRIWSNHAQIDRSRQTELECVVQVVLLTHIGMIWVDLYQNPK